MKFRKIISLITVIVLLSFMTGCSRNDQSVNDKTKKNNAKTVSEILNDENEESEELMDEEEYNWDEDMLKFSHDFKTYPTPDDIDVDLTKMSATMIYSEVSAILYETEKYIGKKIKMHGNATFFYDDILDQYYFACVIQDATLCCAQGLEYVLIDEYSYPYGYPAEGEYIEVVGILDTYQEGEMVYVTLRDAILVS